MIGGICLVSGTSIGAGMLALPTVTGLAGFIPTLCLMLIFWAVLTYTAFLLLEVDLWMKEGSNLVTMAKNTLGPAGAFACWVVYLFLLYCLTTAYLAGSGPILAALIGSQASPIYFSFPLILLFSYFLYQGAPYVDFVNRFLLFALVVCYTFLIAFLSLDVEIQRLARANFDKISLAIPLVATSFGFHIIIPTLTAYMHKNIWELKLSIFIGSLIPLAVYLIWEVVALGILPLHMIEIGYAEGINGARMISLVLEEPRLSFLTELFSFFAIVTSFIGVTLSLSDFLADGLKIRKTHFGKAVLVLLTFVPPMIFIATNPRAFITALDTAGVFGVVVLLVLLPPLMVWSGRYRLGFDSTFRTPGGKIALVLVIAFALAAIGLDIYLRIG